MATITVSPTYQITIPSEIRAALNLVPGQQLQVILYDGRLELIPARSMHESRGFLRGLDTTVEREEDRSC